MPLVSTFGGSEKDQSEEIGLVRRAQKGDEEAFRQLFEQYQRPIFGLIYHALGEREEAADLTQETFVRAFRSLPRLQAPGAFGPWLRRIAANLCRDHYKRAKIPTTSLEATSAEGDSVSREFPDPAGDLGASEVLKGELRRAVTEAVASLSPEHRAVITLHHLEEVSVEEIAEMMHCSIGTVKSRLARARERLKVKLRSYVEG